MQVVHRSRTDVGNVADGRLRGVSSMSHVLKWLSMGGGCEEKPMGLGADSEEKHEPVSDIDTAMVDGLKVLDPNRPIREAHISLAYSSGASRS